MRIADVQLTFPAILIALLIDGLSRSVLPRELHADIWFYVLVLAIGLSFWVQYARTVRSSAMVERSKEYVQAARVIGIPPLLIMLRHVLPNVIGPRSEEHTSELQSLMRISYAVFCLKKKTSDTCNKKTHLQQ